MQDGNDWYYLNPETKKMQTNWLQDGEKWYYLNPVSNGSKGKMQTGWFKDGNKWYYANHDGAIATNSYVDDYYLGADGALI